MRMKEDHMGNGQLKPAYNVQFAVNSEYITGVAAFSNRTDSGTLIPFLNHIQRMQSRSYRDIVADAGYESVRNYLYLEQNGQNCFIKRSLTKNKRQRNSSLSSGGPRIWNRWSMRMVFFVQVGENSSLHIPVPKRKTDLLPPRTITAAKIAPAANSEASVSNPPTG